jgi:hypothetical protein
MAPDAPPDLSIGLFDEAAAGLVGIDGDQRLRSGRSSRRWAVRWCWSMRKR